MLLRKSAGIGTQPGALLRLLQQVHHLTHQGLAVKKRYQPAGLAVGDGFVQRLGVAGHNGATGAHGLQQAPAQYKRVSQVHMHGRELQQANKHVVGRIAHEVHAGQIELVTHLVEKNVFPGLARRRGLAIAHRIAAHNDHPCFGALAQQLGQRPHKDVVPAVGLQVAIDKGDDLVGACDQRFAVDVHRDRRVGHDGVGVYAVVNDRNAVTVGRRKGGRLPARGRNTSIGQVEVQQVVGVLELHPAGIGRVGRGEFRVKGCVAIGVAGIEKLAVGTQPGFGPDVFEKQGFAPARMRHDDVGHKPLRLELQRGAVGRVGADDLGFKIHDPGVDAGRAAAPGLVLHHLHARHCSPRAHTQRHNLVGRIAGKRWREVLELARKTLVDKKNLHSGRR